MSNEDSTQANEPAGRTASAEALGSDHPKNESEVAATLAAREDAE